MCFGEILSPSFSSRTKRGKRLNPLPLLNDPAVRPTRRAVIDVGTNSVKLLVADVSGRCVTPLLEKSEQTRLGAGFYDTHLLQSDAIAKTARAVAQFRNEALDWHPASIRVIATSAARDARNQGALMSSIQQASDLQAEVISGEQEAEWVFAGVTSDPSLAAQSIVVLDVGGGSSEFVVGENSVCHFRQSFRLGTVRLLEELRPSDPPSEKDWCACAVWLTEFLTKELSPALKPALARFGAKAVLLVGTGGTATILARMQLNLATFDRAALDAVRLGQEDVRFQQERLWRLPLAERRQIVGLPPNRADVILTGAAIFSLVMSELGFSDLRVSTRGLRFAALMDSPSG